MLNRTQILLLALAALFLLGLFSPEIYDTDFWWHLRTGQHIAETHSLPSPDPFAWTTAGARDTYPGESRTRQFNLTHEWLAQAMLYGVWRAGGFAGIVAVRALSLTTVCGLIGLVAWRRRNNFWGAMGAALAASSVLVSFALDRPYQVSFLFLAITIAVLEWGSRWLWVLPPIFLIWANCHGGYFLGWVVLGAYCLQSLWRRERDTRLWMVSTACVLVSAANPNGFGIFRTLLDYRTSFMQSKLLEWAPAPLWPLSPYSALLFAAAAVLAWNWRKVRPADWLIFLAFGAASISAQRNIFLTALIAPVMVVGYWPAKTRGAGRRPGGGTWVSIAAIMVIAGGLGYGIARGGFFQFRVAEWRFPSGAADFLERNHVNRRMFNTYEYGGYLIWRSDRVFIDGRALSESVFLDYARILYNHDDSDGLPSGEKLLEQYGIEVIVMNTFEPSGGTLYMLAPALADPGQAQWKLVYQDPQSVIFMRTPPPGVEPLPSLDVLTHMEAECDLHMQHEPKYTRCARSLGQVFARIGDYPRARKWVGIYLQHPHTPDPQAEEAWQRLSSMGR